MTVLEDIVRAFSNPEIYPEPTAKVDVAQTQMSLVFLTDKIVYKMVFFSPGRVKPRLSRVLINPIFSGVRV